MTNLGKFVGRVSDLRAGRLTIAATSDESVPVPVVSAVLYESFSSRCEAGFADKVLHALRRQFAGREENAAPTKADA